MKLQKMHTTLTIIFIIFLIAIGNLYRKSKKPFVPINHMELFMMKKQEDFSIKAIKYLNSMTELQTI